jgi:putative nucleotidyltransferase with HDIG domain
MEPPVDDELSTAEESDRAAEQAAARSLAATVSKAHGVRAFPQSAQRLLSLVGAPTFQVDEVTAAIESDGSLAARVLRVINSPAFGVRVRIRHIRVAVTLLGPRHLTEIATAAAVLDWFTDDSPAVPEIFRHSSSTAAIARHLATRVGLSPEEMYTCGLLHDFGKLIMLQSDDDSYAELVASTMHQPDLIHVEERARFGYDHAVLGAHMFSEWKIPEPLPSVIALHHRPERAFRDGGQIGRMVAVLRWSERLVHEFDEGRTVDEAWLDAMAFDPAARHLDLARGDFPGLCRELQRIYRENQKVSLLDEQPEESDAAPTEPEAAASEAPPPEPSPELVQQAAPARALVVTSRRALVAVALLLVVAALALVAVSTLSRRG